MKLSTEIVCAARNVGKPESEAVFEGRLDWVLRQLFKWTVENSMPKRFEICFARTRQEALINLGNRKIKAPSESFDSIMDELGGLDALLDAEPNLEPESVTVSLEDQLTESVTKRLAVKETS